MSTCDSVYYITHVRRGWIHHPGPRAPSGPGDTMEGNTTTELTGIIAELDTRIARIAARPAFTGSPSPASAPVGAPSRTPSPAAHSAGADGAGP
jgi:hypothetical protein